MRIADADRVRLGAHLAEGTTVMHEGFGNYNAGTLGASMVEGRISAGVVSATARTSAAGLGHGDALRAVEGGRQRRAALPDRGERRHRDLAGDDCVVEAGLYVTAGTKVSLQPSGESSRRGRCPGRTGCCFAATPSPARRGAARQGHGIALNAALHAN